MERTFTEIQLLEARQALKEFIASMLNSTCISMEQYRRAKYGLAIIQQRLIEERIRKQLTA